MDHFKYNLEDANEKEFKTGKATTLYSSLSGSMLIYNTLAISNF